MAEFGRTPRRRSRDIRAWTTRERVCDYVPRGVGTMSGRGRDTHVCAPRGEGESRRGLTARGVSSCTSAGRGQGPPIGARVRSAALPRPRNRRRVTILAAVSNGAESVRGSTRLICPWAYVFPLQACLACAPTLATTFSRSQPISGFAFVNLISLRFPCAARACLVSMVFSLESQRIPRILRLFLSFLNK